MKPAASSDSKVLPSRLSMLGRSRCSVASLGLRKGACLSRAYYRLTSLSTCNCSANLAQRLWRTTDARTLSAGEAPLRSLGTEKVKNRAGYPRGTRAMTLFLRVRTISMRTEERLPTTGRKGGTRALISGTSPLQES